MVSSTAPRLGARWPPVFETTSMMYWRSSTANCSRSRAGSLLMSAGEPMVDRTEGGGPGRSVSSVFPADRSAVLRTGTLILPVIASDILDLVRALGLSLSGACVCAEEGPLLSSMTDSAAARPVIIDPRDRKGQANPGRGYAIVPFPETRRMIPLKDDNPTRIVPFVTVALIAANVAVFVWELLHPPAAREQVIRSLAVIPSEFARLGHGGGLISNGMTLLTAMFLHGSILHLAGNMLYLWIFGNNVEDVMGHARFLLFYLLCGLTGSFVQIAAAPLSRVPMIGASGAIAGVLGAYLVLFPTARVLTLIFVFVFARVVPIPALIVLGFWFLLQLLSAGEITAGGVAWFAHIGGFAAGLGLIVPFRRRRPRQSLY